MMLQKLDPDYDKPKPASVLKKPSCAEGSIVAPARGDGIMYFISAKVVYCVLVNLLCSCKFSLRLVTMQGLSEVHSLMVKFLP